MEAPIDGLDLYRQDLLPLHPTSEAAPPGIKTLLKLNDKSSLLKSREEGEQNRRAMVEGTVRGSWPGLAGSIASE